MARAVKAPKFFVILTSSLFLSTILCYIAPSFGVETGYRGRAAVNNVDIRGLRPVTQIKSDSPKILMAQQAIYILTQVVQKLEENDYVSSQVMSGVAKQVLEELQLDIESHLAMEKMLRNAIKKV